MNTYLSLAHITLLHDIYAPFAIQDDRRSNKINIVLMQHKLLIPREKGITIQIGPDNLNQFFNCPTLISLQGIFPCSEWSYRDCVGHKSLAG